MKMHPIKFVVFLALTGCLMCSATTLAAEAEAMGRPPTTSPVAGSPAVSTADSRFSIDESELNSTNPNVKVIAIGSFISKSDIENGFQAKMQEAIRKFGTLWKEKSSELRVDGRAYQANNGRPLANVKTYYLERRFPEGGVVVNRTTPKVTPAPTNGAPPPNGRQPQPQRIYRR